MVDTIREKEVHDIHHHDESGSGWAVAAIVIIALILFLIFGLPALRGGESDGGANINIPDTVDVNVGGGGAAE